MQKKEKKKQISTKKAKQRQNISTKQKSFKSHSNTLIQPLIKPLSSPYQALIQTLPKSFLTFQNPEKRKAKPNPNLN